MIWVRGRDVSNGRWSTHYAKPGALNVFFDVVMKVLMFIQVVSGVKYPKITTVGLLFEATICGSFVVVPFSFAHFFVAFFIFFVFGFLCLCVGGNKVVSTFFSQLHVNWWAGLNLKALHLEFLTALWTWYLTLLSHTSSLWPFRWSLINLNGWIDRIFRGPGKNPGRYKAYSR